MTKYNQSTARSIFLCAFMLLAILNVACSQSKIDKIDALISKCAEYGKFNGSVLVAEKGEVIYKKGFGFANMEWGTPNQPDTKFRLASITKQFTAMLIVQLVAENKLDLQAPISTYLPDYPKKNGDRITIHHLLTHSSGIPNYTSFPGYSDMMRNPHRPGEIVRIFADSVLEFIPGEKFSYSNSGYVLLGAIIEKVTGKTFEQVLRDKILIPLKMDNTGCDNSSTVLKNRASGYYKSGSSFLNASYIDMSTPFTAGVMYSTVEDLFRWDQALYTETLLPKKYMDLLFSKQISSGAQHYGYGWQIGNMPIGNTKGNLQTIGHGGNINGFNTLITRIPDDNKVILLLNNIGEAPLNDMTQAILGILYDKPYDLPKKSVALSVSNAIEKDGISKALLLFDDIKNSNDYHLDEREMNLVGYEMLQSDRAQAAAAVFKLNVEAFPTSFNVYDSYGEALLALGNKAQAIENYKKSIEINPSNENGVKILKELGIDTDALIPKVPLEYLKLLEGEYASINQPADMNRDWKIVFKLENGQLYGNDSGYRYKVVPVGGESFVNPDDGASLVFDSKNKNDITFVLLGKFKFKKLQ